MREEQILEFADSLLPIVTQSYRDIFLRINEPAEYDEKNELKFMRKYYSTGDFSDPRNETAGYDFLLGECAGYIGDGRISTFTGRTGDRTILLERQFSGDLDDIAMMYIAAAIVKKEYVHTNGCPEPNFYPYARVRQGAGLLVKFDSSDEHATRSAHEMVRLAHALEKAIKHAQAF